MSSVVGTIVAKMVLDIKDFSSKLSQVQNEVNASKKSMEGMSNVADGFTSAGTKLTLGLTAPIVAMGTAAVNASMTFEQQMSKVQAISGATADDMELLNQKAIEMGKKTKFSAKESADAFTYMAMAGWDTKAMLDGVAGIMNLAAADGLDLATTSDIVTDALTAFGLQASDSAHFADVLAVASSAANTNVSMLGESFKYVAPVAGSLGYSVEDTAVALGIMANSGIKASQAGTSLRAAITRMVNPTSEAAGIMEQLGISITNSDGSMKSLNEVMQILRTSFSGLTEEQKAQAASILFGQEAMSGMLAIINSSDKDFDTLTEKINNADGAAEKMAETMMDNTAGAIEQMRGSLETLGITFGDILAPMISSVAQSIQAFADWLNGLDPIFQNIIVGGLAFLAILGPLLLIFGQIAGAIVNIGTLFSSWGSIVGLLGSTFGGLLGTLAPFLPWIAAAVAAIAAIVLIFQNWGSICEWLGNIWQQVVDSWNQGVENVKNKIDRFVNDVAAGFANFLNDVSNTFSGVYNAIVNWISQAVSYLTSLPGKAIQWGADLIQGFIDGIKSKVQGLFGWVGDIAGTISKWLHFSRPDVGPLREYESWMPDMIDGLTRTLRNASPKLYSEIKSLSRGMENNFTPRLAYEANRKGSFGSQENKGKQKDGYSYDGVNITLHIDKFYNNTDKDIKQLTKEVMQTAEEVNKRKRGVFGDEKQTK